MGTDAPSRKHISLQCADVYEGPYLKRIVQSIRVLSAMRQDRGELISNNLILTGPRIRHISPWSCLDLQHAACRKRLCIALIMLD